MVLRASDLDDGQNQDLPVHGLVESIGKLKPLSAGDFDVTKAWRHYNALYFPYVRGLRPYSRNFSRYGLSPTDQRALEWFQAEIPSRTLYNWQIAAAKLVAADLREQLNS